MEKNEITLHDFKRGIIEKSEIKNIIVIHFNFILKILKQISNDNNIDSNSIEMEYLNMIDYVFEQFSHT